MATEVGRLLTVTSAAHEIVTGHADGRTNPAGTMRRMIGQERCGEPPQKRDQRQPGSTNTTTESYKATVIGLFRINRDPTNSEDPVIVRWGRVDRKPIAQRIGGCIACVLIGVQAGTASR